MSATSREGDRYVILQQAAEWYALLASGTAGDGERARWQRWLLADPLHAEAWRQVEAISGQFRDLPAAPARAALLRSGPAGRRAVAAMLVAAVGGVLLWRAGARQDNVPAFAVAGAGSHDSAVGQWRQLQLPDGGQLQLDTGSTVDIDYGSDARRIVLRQGRIYVATAPDQQVPARPLLVQTEQGVLRALGTRFEVAQLDGKTRLAVAQGAVEITPQRGRAHVVPAGQGAQFDRDVIAAPESVAAAAPAWTRKLLLADNMRLDEFTRELGRYRRGYLGCAPEVAKLRLVGAYPLDDQDAVFAMLEDSLPVQVQRLMPWWVTITARASPP